MFGQIKIMSLVSKNGSRFYGKKCEDFILVFFFQHRFFYGPLNVLKEKHTIFGKLLMKKSLNEKIYIKL